jgi:hypothetical protein
MWTDLFKPAASCTSKPGVDRVEHVDGLPMPVSVPGPSKTTGRSSVVAESVDRVDLYKTNTIDAPRLVGVPAVSDAVHGAISPCVAMPTTLASTDSTPSTLSTSQKHCRLMTTAEKNALLARFELDVVRAEMATPVAGHYTAAELRRTINVAWHLLTVERLDFKVAMAKAGAWVADEPMHRDELFFADVLAFSEEA